MLPVVYPWLLSLALSCAGSEAGLPSWLDGGSTRSLAALPAASCVAGEALSVSVGLANPLALELALSGVRLLYEHDGGADGDAEVHMRLPISQRVRLRTDDLPSMWWCWSWRSAACGCCSSTTAAATATPRCTLP